MPITDKQREASRINGAKSRGPITAEGKKASRRNAIKHGLTGTGTVLPEDLRREVEAELAIFEKKHKPRDEYEERLVQQAALATVRWIRLIRAELTRTADRSAAALENWDRDREDRVASLAGLLHDEPAEALRQLRRFSEGCDFLADAWEDLGDQLDRLGSWDDAGAALALRLLGLTGPPTPASPSWQNDVWKAVLALQFRRDPLGTLRRLPVPQGNLDHARRWLPDPDDALETLRNLVAEQHAEFDRRGDNLWESRDAAERAAAPDRDLFDPSPEYARLHRYLVNNERSRRRALTELSSLRHRDAAERATPRPRLDPDAAPTPTVAAAPPHSPNPSAPSSDFPPDRKGAPPAELPRNWKDEVPADFPQSWENTAPAEPLQSPQIPRNSAEASPSRETQTPRASMGSAGAAPSQEKQTDSLSSEDREIPVAPNGSFPVPDLPASAASELLSLQNQNEPGAPLPTPPAPPVPGPASWPPAVSPTG